MGISEGMSDVEDKLLHEMKALEEDMKQISSDISLWILSLNIPQIPSWSIISMGIEFPGFWICAIF